MSNDTIEATARTRGITVDALYREASEQVLRHMTPEHRASVLAREARRAGGLRESRGAVKAVQLKAAAKVADLTPQLEEAFARIAPNTESATVMAKGRGGRPVAAGSLVEAGKGLGLSPAAARQFAQGRAREAAVVKNVAGLSSKAFAYVPDENDPATWMLQICRTEDTGKGWSPDSELVKAAVNSLPGQAPYGAEVAIPASALPDVKATLRLAWVAASLPLDDPAYAVLSQEALHRVFVGMGLSERAAAAAARGRS